MTIANVALTDTFDQQRVKINQLIVQSANTYSLAVASFEYSNTSIDIASNVAANIVISNSVFITTISDRANSFVLPTVNTIYDIANTANIQSANAESNSVIARAVSANAESNAVIALANSRLAVLISSNAESNAILSLANSLLAVSISSNAESNAVIAISIASNAEANIINFTANVSQEVANILSSNAEFTNTVNTVAVSIINNYIATSPINAAFDTANTARSEALAFAIALG